MFENTSAVVVVSMITINEPVQKEKQCRRAKTHSHTIEYSTCNCISLSSYILTTVYVPYLSVLKPGSYTRRDSNIRRVVQQNE